MQVSKTGRYNFFINLQFFQIFLINQPYCLHKTVISMWLLVKLCQFVSQWDFWVMVLLSIGVLSRNRFHSTCHWHGLQIFASRGNRWHAKLREMSAGYVLGSLTLSWKIKFCKYLIDFLLKVFFLSNLILIFVVDISRHCEYEVIN